jgi:hypothetical protein
MNIKRKHVISMVNRALPNPVCRTLDGTMAIQMKYCSGCGENHPLWNFYLVQSNKRKYPNHTRDYCCDCYDAKVKTQKAKKAGRIGYEGSTLDKFFE